MNEIQFLVLKGRHILAQGKRRRSIALGWRTGIKIVRAKTLIKENSNFRTKGMISYFPNNDYNSVRKGLFFLLIEFPRTVLFALLLPRAAFRIIPPETLPWARIFWPFRPEKKSIIDFMVSEIQN